MAQQVIQFTPNMTSFKDAGVLFKAISKNAAQNAELSRAEYSQHMATYKENRALSEQYQARADNTRNKAAAAANRANAFLKDAYDREEAFSINQIKEERKSLIGVSNALARMGEQFKSAKIDEAVTRGVIEGKRLADDIINTADVDPLEAKARVDEFNNAVLGDPDNPRLKAMMRYMLPVQTKVDSMVEDKRRETIALTYTAYLEANGLDLDPKYIKEFADAKQVPVSLIRDADYSYVVHTYADKISKASSMEELNTLNQQLDSIMKKRYDNKYLLQSKSPITRGMVAEANRKLTNAMTEAKANIKSKAYAAMAYMEQNPTDASVSPDKYRQALQETGANERTIARDTESFANKQQQAFIDENYLADFSLLKDSQANFDRVSEKVRKEIIDKASQGIAEYLVTGDGDSLAKALNNNPKIIKKVSPRIVSVFNNLSGVGKEKFYTTLRHALTSTEGIKGLSNLFSDDDLSRILSAGTIVDMNGEYTDKGLNKSWSEAMNMVSGKPRGEVNVLSRSTDKTLFDNLMEDSGEMGANAKRFRNVVTTIYNNLGEVPSGVYKDVKEYFTGMQHIANYKTEFNNLPDYNVVEYTTHSKDPFTVIPDEDYRSNLKTKVFDRVRQRLLKKGLNPDFYSITYMPNNIVVFRDTFGGIVDAVNVTDVIKNSEEDYRWKRSHTVTFGDALRLVGKKGEALASKIWDYAGEVTKDTKKAAEQDEFMQGFKNVIEYIKGD